MISACHDLGAITKKEENHGGHGGKITESTEEIQGKALAEMQGRRGHFSNRVGHFDTALYD